MVIIGDYNDLISIDNIKKTKINNKIDRSVRTLNNNRLS